MHSAMTWIFSASARNNRLVEADLASQNLSAWHQAFTYRRVLFALSPSILNTYQIRPFFIGACNIMSF
ncbi:hypothetical protein OA2633_05857 [Oceanicaulis alexandrii HTCC2633]|nr:hypothetical protein OA2633_05857 [Oceanicaulis alexandrii HTCC2633] [Oceanicaulis sp. HTCC2633]